MEGKNPAERPTDRSLPATDTTLEQPSAGIDVVIVAHNSGVHLAEAVESAVDQAGPGHVWVIDAESTDGSVAALHESSAPAKKALAESIHILAVPNTGFAAGCNRGVQETNSSLILLLNPDAVLLPGALAALTMTIGAEPRAGIVGALILDPDGTVQSDSYGRFPTLARVLAKHLRRAAVRPLAKSRRSPKQPMSTAQVDWVTGATMLVRRAAIAEVGPMDEGFFLYYEDVDWCHRMNDSGWKVMLEPTARVLHYLGGSGSSQTIVAQAYRDSFYRYCKLHGLWGLKLVSRVGLALRRSLGGRP